MMNMITNYQLTKSVLGYNVRDLNNLGQAFWARKFGSVWYLFKQNMKVKTDAIAFFANEEDLIDYVNSNTFEI